MMVELKRWATMNKVFVVAIILIAVFAWMDATQIQTIYNIEDANKWDVYEQFTQPAVLGLWVFSLAIIGYIWFLVYEDKSEALALFVSPLIMLAMGLEDVIFFVFSPKSMTACMDWFKGPQSFFSKSVLGQECTSPEGLILNAILGIIIAYQVYKYLKKKKEW